MEAWKAVGLIIAALASVTAILGALYGIVTVPLLRTVKAEFATMRAEVKTELVELEARIDKRMTEMEKRLNERIDTRLVHR